MLTTKALLFGQAVGDTWTVTLWKTLDSRKTDQIVLSHKERLIFTVKPSVHLTHAEAMQIWPC